MSALEFGEVLDVPISSDPASIMSIIFSERGDAFLSAVRTRQQHCDAGSRLTTFECCDALVRTLHEHASSYLSFVPVVKSEYSNPATPLQPAKPIAIPEIPVTMPAAGKTARVIKPTVVTSSTSSSSSSFPSASTSGPKLLMSKSITVTATGSTKSQDSSLPGSLPVSAASTSSSQTFAEAISNKPNRLDFAAERRRIKDAHSLNSERKSEISVPPPIALPASADAFPERSFQEPVVSSSVREVFTPTSRRKPVVSSVSDSTIYWIDQHIARLQAQQHSAANGLSLSPTKSQPSSIIDLTDTPNVTAIDLFSAKSSDSNSTTASPLSFITTHSSSTVSTKTSLNASVQLQCSPPLKRLVQFYTTILAQRMTKSCISELSWLLRLLCIAASEDKLPTNVAEHSENRLFRSDSFVSLDGGGGGDNVVPSKLFKHAWECVVFAALCLDKLCDDSLMVGLGEKTITALHRHSRIQALCPNLHHSLTGRLSVRLPLSPCSSPIASLPAQFNEFDVFGEEEALGLKPIFDASHDSRHLYKTAALQALYTNRERARDLFLKALQDFTQRGAQAAFDPNAYRLQLSTLVKAFFATLAPANFMWFADLFVQSLLKHAWKDSAALSDWSKLSKDPLKQQRLQALQRRVSRNDTMDSSSSLPAGVSPLSSTHVSPAPSPRLNPTHSQQQNRTVSHMAGGTMYYSAQKEALFATNVIEVFTEMQEFFFVFVEQADSHRFSANLLTTLAAKLSELSDVGSSELCRTFAARVLKLKVVAKFIAALCFAPNFEISALTQQNPTLASTLDEAVAAANRRSPWFDVLAMLRSAWSRGCLVLTVPWVVEVVKLLRYDSISRACDYYRELLSLLSTIYFTQAPPSGLLADSMHWQRNMLYVALEIEEAFRQLDLHPSSCLPSTPSNVVSIGPFMSSNSVHSTPTRRSRPHDSSPFDELRAMSPLDLRPFSPQTPTPTTHSIAPSPAPALLSYASCGDTFDAKSLPNLDRLLLVVSRGYDSVQRVLAQPMLQRPLEHAPTANTMTPKARRITPTVSQAVIAPVTAAESAAGPAVPKAEVGRKIEPKVAEPIGSESRARDDVDASQARSQTLKANKSLQTRLRAQFFKQYPELAQLLPTVVQTVCAHVTNALPFSNWCSALIDVTLRQTLHRTPVPESFPEHSRNVTESTTITAPADVLDAYALLTIDPFPSRVRAKFQRSSNAHDNNRPSESSEAPDEEADSSAEPVNIDSVAAKESDAERALWVQWQNAAELALTRCACTQWTAKINAFCEQRVRAALQALCSPDLSAAVIDQTIRLASKHAVDIALPAAILRIKRLVRTQLDEQFVKFCKTTLIPTESSMSSTIVIASPSPTTSQPATLSNAFVEFDDHVSVDEYQHHLRQLEQFFECDSAGVATNRISRLSQAMIQHFAHTTSTIDSEVFIKSMCVVSRFHIQSYYLHALQSNWSEWCCVMDAIHDKFDMILTLDSIVPRASTTVVPPQLNVPSSSSCSESHSTNVIADSALRSDILFLVVSIVRGWLSLTDFDRRLVSLLTSKSSVAHICHTVCVVVHHIVDIGQAVCARTSTQLLSLMWPQSPDSFVWSDVTQSIQAVLRSVSAQLALMLLRCVDRAERRRMFAAMERVQSVLKALTVEPLK